MTSGLSIVAVLCKGHHRNLRRGPRMRPGQLGRGEATVGGRETPDVITKRHEVARYGFQVIWEEGVGDNARKVSRSQTIASQNLPVTKGPLLAKNKLPLFHIFNILPYRGPSLLVLWVRISKHCVVTLHSL